MFYAAIAQALATGGDNLHPNLLSANEQATLIFSDATKTENWSKAETDLLNIVGKYPTNALTFEYLGDIAIKQKQEPKSVEYYRLAVKNNPENINRRIKLSNAYRAIGNFAEAVKELSIIVRADSANALARYALAELFLQQNMLDDAINELDKIRLQDPPSALSQKSTLKLKQLYLKKAELVADTLGDVDGRNTAVALCERWIQNEIIEPALLLLSEIVRVDPQQSRAQFLLARIYANQNDYEIAAKYYSRGLDIESDNVQAWNGYAQASQRTGRKSEAIRAIEKVIALAKTQPERDLATFQRDLLKAEAMIAIGKTNEALEFYRVMLDRNPENVVLIERISNLYMAIGDENNATLFSQRSFVTKQKTQAKAVLLSEISQNVAEQNYQSASEKITQVLAIDNGESQAYYWLGLVKIAQGDYDAADVSLQKSIGLAPDNAALRKEYARLLAQMGRIVDAEKRYFALYRAEPEGKEKNELFKLYHFVKGQRLVNSGNLPAALAHYQQMAELFPGDLSVLETAAAFAIQTNDLSEAERIYKNMLARDNSRALTYVSLGAVYLSRGELHAGIQFLQVAMIAEPGGGAAVNVLLNEATRALNAGKLEDSHRFLQAVLDVFPNHVVALSSDILVLQNMQRYADTAILFERLLAEDPNNLFTRYEYARLLSIQDDIDRAVNEFEQIMKLDVDGRQGRQASANLDILYSRKADKIIADLPSTKNINEVVNTAQIWINQKRRNEPAKRLLSAIVKHQYSNEQAHYWLGYLADYSNDFAHAIAETAIAISLSPQNPELLFAFARILSRAGNLDVAESLAREIVRVENGTPVGARSAQLLGLIIGQSLVAEKKFDAALSHYENMRQKTPDDASLLSRIVNVLLAKGDVAGAERTVTQILRKEPENSAAHMQAAQIYKRQGNEKRYVAELRKVIDLDRSGSLGREALNQMGLDEAMTLIREKKWNAAIDVLQKVLELEPVNVSARVALATAYSELGDLENADRIITDVLNTHPGSTDARLKRAQILIALHRTAEAEVELERIVATTRDSPIGREAMANLTNISRERAKNFYEKGQIDEAVLAYRKAVNIDPDDWISNHELGRIFQIASQNAGSLRERAFIDFAISRYREVLRVKPDYYQSRLNMGVLFESVEDYLQAQTEFLNAIVYADVENQKIMHLLVNGVRLQTVRFEYAKRNYEWVEQELRAMLLEQQSDARLYLFLSAAYTQMGKLDDSIAALRKAIELSPQDTTIRYRLAQLYEQTDDLELAADQYRAIMLSGQEGVIYDAARERLEFVEERTQLLTFRLRYSNALTKTDITGYAFGPADQTDRGFSSTLQIDSVMHLRLQKNIDFSLFASPSYTSLHDTENDSISNTYGTNLNINNLNGYVSASANYRKTKGLLFADFRGTDMDGSLAISRRINIALPLIEKGTFSPSILQMQLSGRQLDSTSTPAYSVRSLTVVSSFAYPFLSGGSWSVGGSYTDTFNIKGTSDVYASRAFAGNISVRRPLLNRVSGVIGSGATIDQSKRAGGVLAAMSSATMQSSITFGMSVQLHRRLSLNGDISYVDNRLLRPSSESAASQRPTFVKYDTVRLGTSMQYQF